MMLPVGQWDKQLVWESPLLGSCNLKIKIKIIKSVNSDLKRKKTYQWYHCGNLFIGRKKCFIMINILSLGLSTISMAYMFTKTWWIQVTFICRQKTMSEIYHAYLDNCERNLNEPWSFRTVCTKKRFLK